MALFSNEMRTVRCEWGGGVLEAEVSGPSLSRGYSLVAYLETGRVSLGFSLFHQQSSWLRGIMCDVPDYHQTCWTQCPAERDTFAEHLPYVHTLLSLSLNVLHCCHIAT